MEAIKPRPRLKLNRIYRVRESIGEVLVLVKDYYSDYHKGQEEYLLKAISPSTFEYLSKDGQILNCAWCSVNPVDFEELPDDHPAQVLYGKK